MSNPYIYLLRVAWKYARKERRKFFLIYILFIISSLGLAIYPLLYGWLIDSIHRDETQILTTVWIFAACYLGLQLVIAVIHGPTRVMECQLAFNLSQNFIHEFFNKLLRLPIGWHQNNHSGATINRLKKAYGSLKKFFQNGFFYFYTFAQFSFSLMGMLYFSLLWGSIALLLGCLTVWIILKFDKPYVSSLKEVNEREHHMSATLSDSLVNIFTVITLRLENRMNVNLLAKFKNMMLPFRRNVTINEWKWFSADLLVCLIYVIMVVGYCYGHYTPGESFQLGNLVALLGFVNQFTNAFSRVAQSYTEIVGFSTDVRTIDPIEEAYQAKRSDQNYAKISADWRSIEVRRLNFCYEDQASSARDNLTSVVSLQRNKSFIEHKFTAKGLQNIGLTIHRGQRIALIGESGSGKSTLLALLRGLYSPIPGITITVDRKSDFTLDSISDMVMLFPQEPEIFEDTIGYNITLGLPFTEQEIRSVCDIACLTEVIRQLPKGLESTIHEKGVNFSVGQKQRLVLARNILAAGSSSILLLDEPTSSVDTQTEIQIFRRLFDTFSDKTIICSLHSLHLLNLFDYAYVLHQGTIVEEGTAEELQKGEYLRSTNFALTSSEMS